jgi:hypothetical protein
VCTVSFVEGLCSGLQWDFASVSQPDLDINQLLGSVEAMPLKAAITCVTFGSAGGGAVKCRSMSTSPLLC